MKKFLLFLLALALASGLGTWLVQAPADASTCTNPKYQTSDPDGMWIPGRYVVHNDMWAADGYHMTQRLSACSPGNWRVVATADNSAHDGAVKSYPNVHRDYHDWSTGHEPRLSSFRQISSTWAARVPDVGIYNAAYDIWLDGVPGQHEVMIWTHNRHQVPAGSRVGRVTLAGHTWQVWATAGNSYIAFVPTQKLDHGTLDLRQMLTWLVSKGRLERTVTLGQICFGFEIVSTGGSPATFKVDSFSVTSKRR